MKKPVNRTKVAFLGNMNNNHFAMVRYLRAQGVDADLLLFDDEYEHFLPKADTFDTDYFRYTRQLTWGSTRNFLRTSKRQIQDDLAPYDILIGCGLAPAYCLKANRFLDVFTPYGGDLWDYTFYSLWDYIYHRLVPLHLSFHWSVAAYSQKKAIQKVRIFHMPLTNNLYEKQYLKYKGDSQRWIEGVPMIYAPEYEKYSLEEMVCRTHWGLELQKIREKSDLMIVAHGRHVWGKPENPARKGNDILIHGWKLFTENHKHLKCLLVFIEYGVDVVNSKNYIKELDLEDTVVWLPKMYRKDIMPALLMADMVAAEFVHSWMTGGVLYEAMVAGKPILAWRDDEIYSNEYTNLYPIYNAKDPETIAARLKEYISNPETGREMGRQGRRWYEEEVVEKALAKYSGYIDTRAKELGKSLN